jgi:hypothetical protein
MKKIGTIATRSQAIPHILLSQRYVINMEKNRPTIA